MTHLKPGDKAPDFSIPNQNGQIISLESMKGSKFVLYFYPKDNTPTCTTEACNLRDNYRKLQKQGYEILGASPDSEKKHRNFIEKFELPFDLLSDTELTLHNSFGVWGPKKFMGKEFDGVHRTTFLIDEKGKIENIITKVKSKDHSNQILEAREVSKA